VFIFNLVLVIRRLLLPVSDQQFRCSGYLRSERQSVCSSVEECTNHVSVRYDETGEFGRNFCFMKYDIGTENCKGMKELATKEDVIMQQELWIPGTRT
jgi:hypothetical protein